MLRVLLPTGAALLSMVALCIAGLQLLSGLRAYVGGESLWSKARSEATGYLQAYLRDGRPEAYASFLMALQVPEGDRLARLELEKPRPSLEIARQGFLQGGNDPEDVELLVWTYRAFASAPHVQDAVAAWREGDRLVEQMRALGEAARAARAAGAPDASLAELGDRLLRLDGELARAERRFSSTLGRASRVTALLLMTTTAAVGLLLTLAAAWLVRRALAVHVADRQALQDLNERFALAAEADRLGVFVWHVRDDRFELDARGRELYGLPEGFEPRRAELRVQHHPADAAQVRAAFDAAVESGQPLRSRFRVRHPDGGWRHLEVNARLHGRDDPADRRVVGVVRDITDELTEAQLRADKELAERTAAARMAFLSRLSHELRTPLNAILGLAHLMTIDAKEPLAPNQARRVRLLSDSGRALLRLVEDVLDITHLDTGELTLAREQVDLVDVVRACLPLVESERALRDVRIDPALPPEPVWVQGDPQRLQQVFVQLLGNACKFNRPGGRVFLRWHEGEDVALAVCDEGVGLGEAEQAELFQAFKRIDPQPDVPGSGVGLLVVKMLVDQMRGRIEVSSTPGAGSVFTVHLPRR
ncbi:hypothetical protein ISF6_2911 [Piscinibacter sakaiensis]|uniref:histidine kinase n=1 Tax=Piscinibacter sakaiensis TaxID=1547922 RepID=A0A0K8P337_PISS1|nr:hypothetical protein ISF6_2911 [Piscinibacter sakaiensis]